MISTKNEHEWSKYIKFFNETNMGRKTRIGVFEPAHGSTTDYWLESGLAFSGIDLDAKGGTLDVQIRIGELTHVVYNAVKFAIRLSYTGDEDGIDVTDAENRTTVLRFETGGSIVSPT